MLFEARRLNVEIGSGAQAIWPVRNVDLRLDRGDTLGVVGESGCGKSLSALALMGLLPRHARRTADRLVFDGVDLQTLDERRMADIRGARMAMVFQEPMTSLNPSFTVGNQLGETFRRHRGGTARAARDRAVEALDTVGISGAASRLHQYPHQLSGGLRQRVMIAMALMCEPDLLIADEPTTALDVTIQAQILHLLLSLQQRFGMAMVLISHDLGVVARMAQRIAVMYAGEVVEAGTVHEVLGDPLHPYTRALRRCIPVPGKTPRGRPLGSIAGQVPRLAGDLGGCHFRNRCQHAHDRCAPDPVQLRSDRRGRDYRCVLDEPALRTLGEPVPA